MTDLAINLVVMRETVGAIDAAIAAMPSARVESPSDYAYGVTYGALMAIDGLARNSSIDEIFHEFTRTDEEWLSKPDAVKGALAGTLAVAKLVRREDV